MEKFVPDRSKFKDSQGRLLTQSLFVENFYNTDFAMYTLNDEDKTYKGKVYPSLRRLYLETMDPTEYTFATTYLWGWEHWQRLLANKAIREEVEKWREELEVKVRANAVACIMSKGVDSFSAAQWVADGKWKPAKTGRPTKAELEAEKKKRLRAVESLDDDASRIAAFMPRKEG